MKQASMKQAGMKMNGRILVAAFIFLAGLGLSGGLSFAGPDSAAPRFFSGAPDLPLMPGLEEMSDLSLVFDKPEGRVVEMVAAGPRLSLQDVRHYYDTVLPQLGWTRQNPGLFARESEILRIGLEKEENGVSVRLNVSPR